MKCKKDTDAGEFTGGQYDKEKITFSGCGINGNKKEPCGTEGAAAGTIETKELQSVLVWLNEAETELGVGLDGTGAASNGRNSIVALKKSHLLAPSLARPKTTRRARRSPSPSKADCSRPLPTGKNSKKRKKQLPDCSLGPKA